MCVIPDRVVSSSLSRGRLVVIMRPGKGEGIADIIVPQVRDEGMRDLVHVG